MPATAATAHTEVVSTLPSAGAVLNAAPNSVAITFNEALLAASVEASILDSVGALITSVTPEVDGTVVTIPWPAGLAAGGYEVAYRVASGDGHPVTGSVAFSVSIYPFLLVFLLVVAIAGVAVTLRRGRR